MVVWHSGFRQRHILQFTQHNSFKSETIKWNKFELQAMSGWTQEIFPAYRRQEKGIKSIFYSTPVLCMCTISMRTLILRLFCPKSVYLSPAVIFFEQFDQPTGPQNGSESTEENGTERKTHLSKNDYLAYLLHN